MRDLKVAYGNSRQSIHWSNKTVTFADLCERLKNTVRTAESAEEYPRLPREERDSIKDKGGLVGGHLREGRRKLGNVVCRSIGTADIDSPDAGFLARYRAQHRFASVLYTTHSHTPEAPRFRIFVPFARDVSAEEYVAIMRWFAKEIGIECVDPCSYRVHQLMYWPTTPSNGEYICETFDGPWLDPDAYLAAHPGWQDITTLPTSSKESTLTQRAVRRQQDPLAKAGTIGAYNNVFFPISRLIEDELSDVYAPTAIEGRYTHIGSKSTGGAVVYEDKFLYSFHATDPAGGRLLNAFDLLRVHRWGDLGEKESTQEALAYAAGLPEVRRYLSEQHRRNADDCSDLLADEEDDEEWKTRLEYEHRSGKLANTLGNLLLIMQHDPYLKHIGFNQLADAMEIRGPVPWRHPSKFWRDADDAQLICYVDQTYGSFSRQHYNIAVTKTVDDRTYHPIHAYFDGLPEWDGIPRADTLLVDYLGADDDDYVRAVTRKTLCAAYRRLYEPGIKHDAMLVLNGAQGIGKSTLISRLAMEWFSDSLNLADMVDKTAAEKLQGYWILEISELAGMKKADQELVKGFASRQDDKYRAAFGKRVTSHPRQCIFFATTNSEHGYLRDITGNRRFWNVKLHGNARFRPWELTQEQVDQVWAEIRVLAEAGESLELPPALDEIAEAMQREAMEQDEREGFVRDYLDTLLPENWAAMDLGERRDFLAGDSLTGKKPGTVRRTAVCNLEIWCECFGKRKEDLQPKDSYAIAAMMVRIAEWKRAEERTRFPIYGVQRYYRRE